jgi:hypothetical protein
MGDQQKKDKPARSASCGGPLYGLGMIGALVWTWQQADGIGEHLVGILQALVWPAFVVYDLLDALHR